SSVPAQAPFVASTVAWPMSLAVFSVARATPLTSSSSWPAGAERSRPRLQPPPARATRQTAPNKLLRNVLTSTKRKPDVGGLERQGQPGGRHPLGHFLEPLGGRAATRLDALLTEGDEIVRGADHDRAAHDVPQRHGDQVVDEAAPPQARVVRAHQA